MVSKFKNTLKCYGHINWYSYWFTFREINVTHLNEKYTFYYNFWHKLGFCVKFLRKASLLTEQTSKDAWVSQREELIQGSPVLQSFGTVKRVGRIGVDVTPVVGRVPSDFQAGDSDLRLSSSLQLFLAYVLESQGLVCFKSQKAEWYLVQHGK